MKLTFRWYGDSDPVTLQKIRQIPTMSGIVSAIYDVTPGGVWSRESIAALKKKANDNGLAFEVVESVPVPEDIKLGNEKAAQLIDNYCENIRRLGEAGVKCVCYNFMPVFDWLRSELEHAQPDGANALAKHRHFAGNENDLTVTGFINRNDLYDILRSFETDTVGQEVVGRNFQTAHTVTVEAAFSGRTAERHRHPLDAFFIHAAQIKVDVCAIILFDHTFKIKDVFNTLFYRKTFGSVKFKFSIIIFLNGCSAIKNSRFAADIFQLPNLGSSQYAGGKGKKE